ncbi:MAG TPA: hypothetical protein VG652_08370 [Gaiellaceae bacterium]|nr:hypothetical protein [Gaiellaceae bacterium]
MNPADFGDLIDDGLDAAEQQRLRAVHELLLAAGPPPELPAGLAQLKRDTTDAEVIRLPSPSRRRPIAAVAVAATVAAAVLGGYLLGHGSQGAFKTVWVVSMQGQSSYASIRVGPDDGNGNSPLELSVSGLPPLTGQKYYELMLMHNGKPAYPCGRFVMHGHATTLYWTVPYKITGASKWVVMVLTPKPGQQRPFRGPVVLT